MTVFYGVCIGNEEKYRRLALQGLRRIGAENRVLESRGNRSIFLAYNDMLEKVARCGDDADALVLLHEDLEIRDGAFESKILAALDDDTAIVGTIGGRGVVGTRWRSARAQFGRQPDTEGENDMGRGVHVVDQVDGCLLVLSRWAIENLRFDDERFHGFHAYDADICMQASAAGRAVKVADVETFHHNTPGFGDIANHQRSDDIFRRKWGLPPDRRRWRWSRRYPKSVGRVRRLMGHGR